MIKAEPDEVMAWLTEMSLRPCDFTREDFDAYETEILVNTVIDMVERNEPIKVTRHNKYWATCKDCGNVFRAFMMAAKKARYCPNCGRRLEWDERDHFYGAGAGR